MTASNYRRISGVQGHRRSLRLDDEFAGQQIGGLVVGVQVFPSLTLEFPLVDRDIAPGRSVGWSVSVSQPDRRPSELGFKVTRG